MMFLHTQITEGVFQRKIDWSDGVNLIYSSGNSTGKTTLLRLLLYSLGYPIPNTKNIKFSNCVTRTTLKYGDAICTVTRRNDYLEVSEKDAIEYYILPSECNKFLSKIFFTEELNVIENLLGAFYVDQEKGWTLLNRGTVIGKIRFSVDELVRGLAGRNTVTIENLLASVKADLKKYEQMFSIAEYKRELNLNSSALVYDGHKEEIEQEVNLLELKKKSYEKEISRINKVIRENQSFLNYIENLKLVVLAPSGEKVPVNKKTIIGYDDNIEYLLAKRRLISNNLSNTEKSIQKLIPEEETQLEMQIGSDSPLRAFDAAIARIKIDQVDVKNIIASLKGRCKELEDELKANTRNNNRIVESLHKVILKYTEEFDVQKYINLSENYIFTSDLKSLSGAILHKIVFSFKLAYITTIQETLGIKLPIILDSPSGRELEKENIDAMMNVLKRDFRQNQIIIASIFGYDFDDINKIELHQRVMDSPLESPKK
jgi:hypothetical protein